MGFEFQEIYTNSNNLEVSGIELSSLLEKKAVKEFIESKNLNIFTTNQLVEAEGHRLLIWQQLCLIRGRKASGRKPNWYNEIEKKMLADNITRKLAEDFKLIGTNQEAIKAKKQRISRDRRKKEWVITKVENILLIGKIIKKTERKFSIAHWKIEKSNNTSQTILTKCNGCNFGKKNGTDCIVSKHMNKWHQVVEEIVKREENIVELKIPLSAFSDRLEQYTQEELNYQSEVWISVANLEEAIIQRVIEEENIQRELSIATEKLRGKELEDIYTDG